MQPQESSREQVIIEFAFAHYSFHPNAPPPSTSLKRLMKSLLSENLVKLN